VSEAFASLVAASATEPADEADAWTAARESYAVLRAHLQQRAAPAANVLVGSVFKTESTMDYLATILEGLDTYTLSTPTRAVRWDPETSTMLEGAPTTGEALTAYFGETSGRFVDRPGRWSGGSRDDVALMEGSSEPYRGGTLHKGIAEVHHGSILVPALNFAAEDAALKNTGLSFDNGSLTWSLEAMVPFTLFLCEGHVDDPSNLPLAIFTHGGTSDRTDAIGYATLNCLEGVATLAADMPFHAGRSATALDAAGKVILPSRIDTYNIYTDLTDEDAGFVPDHVGDNPGAVDTAGNLFGIAYSNDPLVMEANLLMFSLDTYVLIRHVGESDWSGIREGLSFDTENLFHDSLSFGTTLTTALWAGTSAFKAIFNGVGAAYLYSANLTVAPSNGRLASSVVQPLLGLKSSPAELQQGAYMDPIVAMIQWLSQRGDSVGYAPYVLRHREVAGDVAVLGVGNSWDETLSSWAQYTYNVAFGYEYFRAEPDWSIDPSITGVPADLGTPMGDTAASGNMSFGDRSYTAGMYFSAASCHALQVKPVCVQTYMLEYPPITDLPEKVVFDSPICAYQNQARHFLKTAMAGAAEIVAPSGDCESLYGTNAP